MNMLFLKRLRDTDNVKMVYAKGPSGYDCQVWTDETGEHLYIYDVSQWLVYDGVSTPGMVFDMANWKNLTDETVGYYETNDPKDLYNWDHLDGAYYQFVNYDGQVLQSGTVDEGETPEYTGATPTKPDSATEAFIFSGWNPAVGPITKRTVYTAQYTATPLYTVTATAGTGGTVSPASVKVPSGTTTSVASNVITFSNGSTITATANSGYQFDEFTGVPATITEDVTITAAFEQVLPETLLSTESGNILHDIQNGEIILNYTGPDEYVTPQIIISDKNVGATEYLGQTSDNLVAATGDFFQWGNKNGFTRAGATTTSTSRVDTSGYSPSTYDSDTFIVTSENDWQLVDNTDLWGGVTNTDSAKIGPCEDGYHVPSLAEVTDFFNVYSNILGSLQPNLPEHLLIPFEIGKVNRDGDFDDTAESCYWTVSTNTEEGTGGYAFGLNTDDEPDYSYAYAKNIGYTVRGFKNASL